MPGRLDGHCGTLKSKVGMAAVTTSVSVLRCANKTRPQPLTWQAPRCGGLRRPLGQFDRIFRNMHYGCLERVQPAQMSILPIFHGTLLFGFDGPLLLGFFPHKSRLSHLSRCSFAVQHWRTRRLRFHVSRSEPCGLSCSLHRLHCNQLPFGGAQGSGGGIASTI